MSNFPRTPKRPLSEKEQKAALRRIAIKKGIVPRYEVWVVSLDYLDENCDEKLFRQVLDQLEALAGAEILGHEPCDGYPDYLIRPTTPKG